MNLLRNGWTWAAVFAVWAACLQRSETSYLPEELRQVGEDLRSCQLVQSATEAQKDGLMLQTLVLSGEIQRLNGEVNKANQWSAGARRVIGQLELKCRTYNP